MGRATGTIDKELMSRPPDDVRLAVMMIEGSGWAPTTASVRHRWQK
jgi:hypothetical protein